MFIFLRCYLKKLDSKFKEQIMTNIRRIKIIKMKSELNKMEKNGEI